MNYTLGEIAHLVKGKLLYGDEFTPVNGVSVDTRILKAGELFFALKGKVEGAIFAEEAIKKGAPGVVVRKDYPGQIPKIEVDDPLESLQNLAYLHRKGLDKLICIGITGSVGKTTVKELISLALSSRFRVKKSPKSFNNFIGVPLTLLTADVDTEVLVLEVGTSHAGETELLTRLGQPNVAVLTKIGRAHLEFFGTEAAIAEEKALMFKTLPSSGIAIFNRDSPHLEIFERVLPRDVKKIYYGQSETCDIWPYDIKENEKIAFKVKDCEFILPIVGRGNLSNALASIATAYSLGVSLPDIRDNLIKFSSLSMRMEPIKLRGIEIINDAYNANPDSVVELLATFKENNNKRQIFILGDMLELGEQSELLHREVGKHFARLGHKILITCGDAAKFIAAGAREAGVEKVYTFENIVEIVEFLKNYLQPSDRLLLKASRKLALETIVDKLQGSLS